MSFCVRLWFASLSVLLLIATPAAAAPVVLVDQSHDQRFVIEKDGPLHLSSFSEILKGEGLVVKSSSAPLTEDALQGVDAVIISGPFRGVRSQEVEALLRFVEHGGKLCIMLHIGAPFSELLHRFDVDFTNLVLQEQEHIIGTDPKNFQVRSFETVPLFSGLDHFSLYGSWALMNTSPGVRILASTSPKGWVDLDADGKISTGDAVQSFGVVVSGEFGAGSFVVFGDDALFQNRFLDGSNRQLAANLARWLK